MHGDPSPKKSAPCSYTITSSVILSLGIPEGEHKIKTSFGGTLSRKKQASMNASSADEHVANMGTLLEDMEKKMRVELEQLYFGVRVQT
jgi:capping protein beta